MFNNKSFLDTKDILLQQFFNDMRPFEPMEKPGECVKSIYYYSINIGEGYYHGIITKTIFDRVNQSYQEISNELPFLGGY